MSTQHYRNCVPSFSRQAADPQKLPQTPFPLHCKRATNQLNSKSVSDWSMLSFPCAHTTHSASFGSVFWLQFECAALVPPGHVTTNSLTTHRPSKGSCRSPLSYVLRAPSERKQQSGVLPGHRGQLGGRSRTCLEVKKLLFLYSTPATSKHKPSKLDSQSPCKVWSTKSTKSSDKSSLAWRCCGRIVSWVLLQPVCGFQTQRGYPPHLESQSLEEAQNSTWYLLQKSERIILAINKKGNSFFCFLRSLEGHRSHPSLFITIIPVLLCYKTEACL